MSQKTTTAPDYFSDNVRLARILNPDIRECFRQMSAYQLEFADNSVVCVTLLDVIEHLEGAAVAVKEINRALRTGGSLIISTPSPMYWRQMFLFFFEWRNFTIGYVVGRRG